MALNIGIVGYGAFGHFLREAWSGLDGIRVAAAADQDAGRDPGDIRFYADIRRLLADPDVDLVSIATPPSTHADLACEAMQAGKHVLVEKPLATTVADAERVLEVQRKTSRVAGINFMLRFNPIVEAVHAWCRSGCFGRLRRVVVENYAQDETLAPEHWFWDRAVSGGILIEHAVHFIDIVNGCTTAGVERVDGLAISRNERQQDRMMATVTYSDGLVASHFHAFIRPTFFEQTSMRFVFDLAQLDVRGWIPMEGTLHALVSEATRAEVERLPGLEIVNQTVLTQGGTEAPEGGRLLRSGGEPYHVRDEVVATFSMPGTKAEAYAAAVRSLLLDVGAAFAHPSHALRVSLEDGCRSLRIASQATADAQR